MNAKNLQLVVIACVLAVLATVPLWVGNSYYVNVTSQILFWAIFALGLNVLVGYGGLVSLGHAGLLGMAGYTLGLMLLAGHGHLAAIAAALVVTVAAAAVFAMLSLRATGIGFLMITLALGQILWGIAYRWASLTNGDNGINITSRPAPFGIALSTPTSFYYATLIVFAVCLATANVGTRMWYGMARSGSFPKALAKVHPTYRTPTNAVLLQMCLALASGLIGGLWFKPDVSFFFIDGLILVLGVAFVYIMANIAVGRYYLGERRREFNPILHLLFPIISSAVLLYAIAISFQPLCTTVCPASPFKWASVVDGAWLLIGIGVLVWYRARRREDWVRRAGAALGESEAELERTVGYP